MPLPLTVSCFSKIQIGLPFWYWLTRVVADKEPLNRSVCVCMCVTLSLRYIYIRYRDSVEENSSVFSLMWMRWLPSAEHAGSKTLHQQNPPILIWRCWLWQVDLYNGCKTGWLFCCCTLSLLCLLGNLTSSILTMNQQIKYQSFKVKICFNVQ